MTATLAPPTTVPTGQCPTCGHAMTPAPLVRTGPLVVDVEQARAWVGGNEARLPRTEAAILVYLARRLGTLCRREDVLANVWGAEYVRDYPILGTSLSRLRISLGDAGALIETRVKVGLTLHAMPAWPQSEMHTFSMPPRLVRARMHRPYLSQFRYRVLRALEALPPEGGDLTAFCSALGRSREQVSSVFWKLRVLGAVIQVEQARGRESGWVRLERTIDDPLRMV